MGGVGCWDNNLVWFQYHVDTNPHTFTGANNALRKVSNKLLINNLFIAKCFRINTRDLILIGFFRGVSYAGGMHTFVDKRSSFLSTEVWHSASIQSNNGWKGIKWNIRGQNVGPWTKSSLNTSSLEGFLLFSPAIHIDCDSFQIIIKSTSYFGYHSMLLWFSNMWWNSKLNSISSALVSNEKIRPCGSNTHLDGIRNNLCTV